MVFTFRAPFATAVASHGLGKSRNTGEYSGKGGGRGGGMWLGRRRRLWGRGWDVEAVGEGRRCDVEVVGEGRRKKDVEVVGEGRGEGECV